MQTAGNVDDKVDCGVQMMARRCHDVAREQLFATLRLGGGNEQTIGLTSGGVGGKWLSTSSLLVLCSFLDLFAVAHIVPLLPAIGSDILASASSVTMTLGGLASAYGAMQLVASPIAGALCDKHGRRRSLIVACSATAVAYTLLACATSLPRLFVARCVAGLVKHSCNFSRALLLDGVPPHERMGT
jgi:MFS family permease